MKTVPVSSLVSQVNTFLKRAVNLEAYYISGELSNVKKVNGHIYFDLKDDKGQLSCTLWKSQACKLPFEMEDGMAVLVHGALNVYEKRGSLQLNCDSVQIAGLGTLYLELEARKKKLAAAGYFDAAHKKPRPAWIDSIGIVTGASTAALQDVMKTIRTRWPMLKVTLFPASVQGEQAPAQIVKALKRADQAGLDAILLVRGGGSFEDLFCFNDEEIVKTLYDMKTYTVCGVGHEVDTSLADLAADHRALTPTAAAQWVTPDQKEVRKAIESDEQSMIKAMQALFASNSGRLVRAAANPYLMNPMQWASSRALRLDKDISQLRLRAGNLSGFWNQKYKNLDGQLMQALPAWQKNQRQSLQKLDSLLALASPKASLRENAIFLEAQRKNLETAMKNNLAFKQNLLDKQENLLSALSWENTLQRGFAIVYKDSKPVTDAASLDANDEVRLQLAKGSANAVITEGNTNGN